MSRQQRVVRECRHQRQRFPARTIVPGHYGMKSVQWFTDIEVAPDGASGIHEITVTVEG
ncbi:MAG TPA: molybdopterin-dependent oxidoreductase [Nitrospira sp.]|nr:molybdopterin-dependent oxidoreductase [Nitrospira sp.]